MRINNILTSFLLVSGKALSVFLVDSASSLRKEAEDYAAKIGDEFDRHPANHAPFFDYLNQIPQEGINSKQFLALRDNYLVRTEGTFFSVMQKAIHIAKKGNYDLLPLVMRNAAEEGGASDDKPHMALLEKAFNIFGRRVFGVSDSSIVEAKKSEFLVDEVNEFRKKQDEIYKLSNEQVGNEEITGRYFAHEKAAVKMLGVFKQLFVAYKHYFNDSEYKEMMQYFDAHIPEGKSGVEERHGSDAFLVVAAAIYSAINDPLEKDRVIGELSKGGKEMLDAQENLWKAIKERMEDLSNLGKKISIKDQECVSYRDVKVKYSSDDLDVPSKKVSAKDFENIVGSSTKNRGGSEI